MSRIRTNLITNRIANGAPTVSNGLVISGVTTSTNVTTAIDAIIKNTVHDCELQILATYSNKNSKLLFGDAADDDVGIIDYDHNTNNMHFTVNAGERLRITSAGSVGINSTSPDRRFTLHQDATCRMNLKSLANSTAGIEFGDEADHNAGYIVYDNTDNSMQFGVNAGEKLRINSSGHMGLGVTPNTNWPTNADFKALQIGTGACVFGRGSGDEDRGGIAVNWYSTGSANKYIGNGNAARIYLADGNIYFANAGANSSGANAAMTITDRMTINVNGDIGVNCTPLGSDPFKLDVAGTAFNVARFSRSGGAAGVRIEGNGATEAVYLSLKTLNTTANSGCVIEGVDADGNGTSWIKLYTENNSTNAGAISLHTRPAGGSTTERFRIDSNGYVTKPNHPSFHARRVNNASSTTNPLVFDSVHQNNGSHYKSSGTDQGKFVAPVSGVYLFYWTAIKTNNGSVCRLYINVDGSHIYSNMHLRLQEQGTYSNGSMQAIVNLNAGQKVHISLEAGDIHGNEYTHFGGYLIH